ncbi:MAG: histidine phosphatase family protein [Thermochromatium sp.]
MSECLIDLLRHGAVQGGERFRGECDDPLSALGWEQLRRATAVRSDWTHLVSSPARRCADFARELAATRHLPLTLMESFRERGFGAWEGRAATEIPADELQRFWNDPVGYTPPGAEPFPAFRARVLMGWRKLLAVREPWTLLITHGGVIRVLVAEVLHLSDQGLWSLEVPYACLTRLRIYPPPGRPSLMAHGSIA